MLCWFDRLQSYTTFAFIHSLSLSPHLPILAKTHQKDQVLCHFIHALSSFPYSHVLCDQQHQLNIHVATHTLRNTCARRACILIFIAIPHARIWYKSYPERQTDRYILCDALRTHPRRRPVTGNHPTNANSIDFSSIQRHLHSPFDDITPLSLSPTQHSHPHRQQRTQSSHLAPTRSTATVTYPLSLAYLLLPNQPLTLLSSHITQLACRTPCDHWTMHLLQVEHLERHDPFTSRCPFAHHGRQIIYSALASPTPMSTTTSLSTLRTGSSTLCTRSL